MNKDIIQKLAIEYTNRVFDFDEESLEAYVQLFISTCNEIDHLSKSQTAKKWLNA